MNIRTRGVAIGGAVAAAGTAALLIATAAGAFGSSRPHVVRSASLSAAERQALSRVSTPGIPFVLPAGDVRTQRLASAGLTTVTELTSQGQTTFFRLASTTGHACYAWGKTGAAWPLSVVGCRTGAPFFPSSAEPLMDQSTVGSDSTNAPLRFIELAGVAADGVVAIQGLDAAGSVVLTIPVVNNVYYASPAQVPDGVASIEAVDAQGRVLATVPKSS